MREIQKENKEIKLKSLVRLMIGDVHWIGEVVDIMGDVFLIQLTDNMHYHAKLEELELLTP